jgi:putative ABC transport system substrate-binding protein
MIKKITVLTLGAMLFALSFPAGAQQPMKVPRIGLLVPGSSASYSARIEALRQGLRDLGYMEEKNIVIEYRFADGKLDHLSELAAELTRLRVDLIVTSGGASVDAAKRATSTIPIIAANTHDLVGPGHAASLARPGGNVTGLTNMAPELAGKRLELLKEAVLKLSLVAVLWWNNTADPGPSDSWKESQLAARELRLSLHSMEVRNANDFEPAFEAAAKARGNALAVTPSPLFSAYQKKIIQLAAKNRLQQSIHRGST